MTEQYQHPQHPGQMPSYAESSSPEPTRKGGRGVAALVLGIVGLVLCWVPFVGLILGALAVIVGIVGLVRRNPGRGKSITGIVTGAVATFFGLYSAAAGAILGLALLDEGNKKFEVKYEVTVEGGPAHVYYGINSKDPMTRIDDVQGEWGTVEKHTGLEDPLGMMRFTLWVASNDTTSVTCKITVNGKVLVEDEGPKDAQCSTDAVNR